MAWRGSGVRVPSAPPDFLSCRPGASARRHPLESAHLHDYRLYVRDAENAGHDEIAGFFREVMEEDAQRARKVHDFLAKLGGTDNTSPQG